MTRTLEWDGCLNVRDLGGVPLSNGETRFGVLVRADNIRKLSDAGWRSLAGHGVVRIVDLRWAKELDEDPPRDVHVDVVHVSLLGEFDADYTDDIDEYMAAGDVVGYWVSSYVSILDEHRAHFGRAVAAIADAPEGVVVFHCAGGKDRTGLVAALLLRLAGATSEDVAADYALTEANLHAGPRTWVESAPDEATRRRRLFMDQTPAEVMVRTLDELDARWGGVRPYLRGAGVTDEQLDRLEARLAPA